MKVNKKICEYKINGNCTNHNLFCKYPECEIDETIIYTPPTPEDVFKENGFADDMLLPKHLVTMLMNKYAQIIKDTK